MLKKRTSIQETVLCLLCLKKSLPNQSDWSEIHQLSFWSLDVEWVEPMFSPSREKLTSFVNGHLQDNLPMLQSRKQQPHFNSLPCESAIVWKPFERVKIPSQRQNNPSKNHLCYFSTLSNFFLFFLLCLCWNARDFWKTNHLWRASLTQSFFQRYTFNCKQKCSISMSNFPFGCFQK